MTYEEREAFETLMCSGMSGSRERLGPLPPPTTEERRAIRAFGRYVDDLRRQMEGWAGVTAVADGPAGSSDPPRAAGCDHDAGEATN